MLSDLLYCLGEAVVNKGAQVLLKCVPFGEALYEIANETLLNWKLRQQSAVERCGELEQLAQADSTEVSTQARTVAQMVAPPELRGKVQDYLERLPGVVRRSLSRPEDPSGRTAPAGLPLDKPEDLVPFLPPRPPRFRPGDRPKGVNGWTLVELLGVGGFGEVWLGRKEGHQAALKFCFDAEASVTLENELQLLQRLQKQVSTNGLVRVHRAFLEADPPYLVLDYVPGGDLTRLIRCWHDTGQWTSARLLWDSLRLIHHLAKILAEAHRMEIVHRDLKPSNVLLQPSGEKRVRVRVTDFGIGGIAAEKAMVNSLTCSAKEALTTSLRGAHTPLYASPQQKEGEAPAPTDDVFALGVIGYQALVGDMTLAPPPDMRDELAEREVPEPVTEILESCLLEDAEDRPPNASELAVSLKSLSDHLPRPNNSRPF